VWLKDGKKEIYDLTLPAEKEKFQRKYQPLPATSKQQSAVEL
jgi:hypothetical protein